MTPFIPSRWLVLAAAALDPPGVMLRVDRLLVLPGITALALLDIGSPPLLLARLGH